MQHPLIQRYWHDANVQVQDFTNEDIVASSSWPFQVNTLVTNKQPVQTHQTAANTSATCPSAGKLVSRSEVCDRCVPKTFAVPLTLHAGSSGQFFLRAALC